MATYLPIAHKTQGLGIETMVATPGTTKPPVRIYHSLISIRVCSPVPKFLKIPNAYSEAYEELEQFETIDTLNYMDEIVNDHTPPKIVDDLNN